VVQTPDGTTIVADGGTKSWPCRFRVLVNGNLASVGAGFLAGKAPVIVAGKERIPIDELDAEGLPTLTVPAIELKRFPAENGARSWLCVRVLASDPAVSEMVHAATPDGRPAGVKAVEEAMASLARGGAAVQPDGYVYQAVAVVNWNEDTVRNVVQTVTQDLAIGWIPGAAGGVKRAFFWAV
jgi:hypothetical protein